MSVPPPPNQWGPQQPWGPPWGPPQRGGGKGKWILGGIAVLAVIAVTVVITVAVVGKDSNGQSPPPTNGPTSTGAPVSNIASVNDKGPATIITDDPTCAASSPIFETVAARERNGWDARDPSIPASAWTPDMRTQYEAVGEAWQTAADQIVPLAKLTPHRVMRELFEQFIAYTRAYADRIPTYAPQDNDLALVSNSAADAISRICAAISYGSAAARGPLVPLPPEPSQIAPAGDPAEPRRFLTERNPVCGEWSAVWTQFQKDTVDWLATDPNIPASQWTPQQRAVNDGVVPVMRTLADKLQALGDRSGDPILQDFAVLSAQYRRAYVEALPTYVPSDNYLASAALKLGGVTEAACAAAGK